jgi:hypothetical protein
MGPLLNAGDYSTSDSVLLCIYTFVYVHVVYENCMYVCMFCDGHNYGVCPPEVGFRTRNHNNKQQQAKLGCLQI